MNIFEGLILGAIQGITEWLPISSSGQSMLILINILNISPEQALSISLSLHLGSLFAVIVYFRKKLKGILLEDRRLREFIIYASITSAAVGLPIYLFLRTLFSHVTGERVTMFIGVMLIVTGLTLRKRGSSIRSDFNNNDALLTGAAQGFAVLPGISRSGATIAVLLLKGIEQETALMLSFLLAIPAVLGLALFEFSGLFVAANTLPVLFGIFSSFIVSLGAMHYLIKISKKTDFSVFVIAIGAIALFVPVTLQIFESLAIF